MTEWIQVNADYKKTNVEIVKHYNYEKKLTTHKRRHSHYVRNLFVFFVFTAGYAVILVHSFLSAVAAFWRYFTT